MLLKSREVQKMKDGFIKVAAASIRVSVAGVNENKKRDH